MSLLIIYNSDINATSLAVPLLAMHHLDALLLHSSCAAAGGPCHCGHHRQATHGARHRRRASHLGALGNATTQSRSISTAARGDKSSAGGTQKGSHSKRLGHGDVDAVDCWRRRRLDKLSNVAEEGMESIVVSTKPSSFRLGVAYQYKF